MHSYPPFIVHGGDRPNSEHVRKKRYQIIASPVNEPMARRLQAKYPER